MHHCATPRKRRQLLNRSDQVASCSYTSAGTGATTSTPGPEWQLHQRKPRWDGDGQPGPEPESASSARRTNPPPDFYTHLTTRSTREHELGFPPPKVQIDAPTSSQTDRDKGVRCRAPVPVPARYCAASAMGTGGPPRPRRKSGSSVASRACGGAGRRGGRAGASSRALAPRPRPRGARRGRLARGGARGCRACRSARAPPTAFNALPCRERGRRERGTVGGGSDAIQARRARSRCRHLAGAGPAAARASDGPLPLAACRRLTCRRQLSHSAGATLRGDYFLRPKINIIF